MSTVSKCFWNGRNLLWNDSTNLTWADVSFCQDFVSVFGDSKPTRRKVSKEIDKLSKEDKEKFIEIFLKVGGRDYSQKKKVKKIELSVEDVAFVLKEAVNVKIFKD